MHYWDYKWSGAKYVKDQKWCQRCLSHFAEKPWNAHLVALVNVDRVIHIMLTLETSEKKQAERYIQASLDYIVNSAPI